MGKQLGYKLLPFDEKLNVLTHAISLFLALLGGVILFSKLSFDNYLELASVSIYFFALCFMFFASTIYHMTLKPELKHRLRILDHILNLIFHIIILIWKESVIKIQDYYYQNFETNFEIIFISINLWFVRVCVCVFRILFTICP